MTCQNSIPIGWSIKKLCHIGDLKNGINKDSDDFGYGTPFVNLMDVFGKHEIDTCDLGLVNASIKEIENYKLIQGDVLFIRSSVKPEGVGLAAVVTNLPDDTVYSGFLIRLRPKLTMLSNEYSKYCFLEDCFRRRLLSCSTISANTNINQDSLGNLELLLPPINEQKIIARIIDCWDKSIVLTEHLVTTKQERRTWLIQQLLTGKKRLPGFEKNKELRKTPFGTLPAEWEYPRIGVIAKEVSERNGDESTRPVLSCTKHNGLVDSLKYFGKRIFSENLSNYKVVRRGHFAYATNHIDEGSIGYQDTYDEALISPIYTVFKANDTIDDRFLFLILKTETYRHIFASNTSASVDRRGSLRWSDFAKIHIPHPSIEEQKAIVKVINTADRELSLLRDHLDALQEQKKGLMQQLLTGKRRVKLDYQSL